MLKKCISRQSGPASAGRRSNVSGSTRTPGPCLPALCLCLFLFTSGIVNADLVLIGLANAGVDLYPMHDEGLSKVIDVYNTEHPGLPVPMGDIAGLSGYHLGLGCYASTTSRYMVRFVLDYGYGGAMTKASDGVNTRTLRVAWNAMAVSTGLYFQLPDRKTLVGPGLGLYFSGVSATTVYNGTGKTGLGGSMLYGWHLSMDVARGFHGIPAIFILKLGIRSLSGYGYSDINFNLNPTSPTAWGPSSNFASRMTGLLLTLEMDWPFGGQIITG